MPKAGPKVLPKVRRGREFLNVPGPTNIPGRILNAMHRPAIDFSGPEFIELAKGCFEDLRPIFRTAGDVFIYAANGHGAWEAALVNTLSPGDFVLAPETGHFSTGWKDTAEALGVEVRTIPSDWRTAIDPQAVEDALRADTAGRIRAVLMVHTDTATGVTSDVPAVRRAIDAAGHPALFMVDTIASLGTVAFEMDQWGVDVAVGASQKGLMMPPGLGFVAANDRAREAHERAGCRNRYWDWTPRSDPEHYRKFCGTAPEHLIFALREAIDMLNEETLEGAIARHTLLAEAVKRAVEVWTRGGALAFNARIPAQRSNSVTTILTPEGYDATIIRTMLREEFRVAVGGGLGRMMGRAFRIGHMGDLNEPMILGVLGCVEAALARCGVAHEKGGASAAIDWLAQAEQADLAEAAQR